MGKPSKKKTAKKKAAAAGSDDKKKEERAVKRQLRRDRRAKQSGFSPGDVQKSREQLEKLGLTIRTVEGDGNCLFRSLGDQLYGDELMHPALRERTVTFMRENPDQFAPFLDEEDGPFETYLNTMGREGEWGGNLELQAASCALDVNIVLHQLDAPRWELTNFGPWHRTVHLSYHDGQHYNSVRLLSDGGAAPAKPITLGEAATSEKGDGNQKGLADGSTISPDEDLILRSTVNKSLAHVRDTLRAVEGDVEAAIEILVAESTCGHDAPAAVPAPDASALPTSPAPSVAESTPANTNASTTASPRTLDRPTLTRKQRKQMKKMQKRAALEQSTLSLSNKERKAMERRERARGHGASDGGERQHDSDEDTELAKLMSTVSI